MHEHAILLIHGFPLGSRLWTQTIAELASAGRPVLAPDLAGFAGRPLAPRRHASIASYADDLVATLDGARIRRAIVCGLSMGGYIAFEIYRRYAERVIGLGLVSTRAEPDGDEGRAGRERMMETVRRDGVGAVAEELVPRLVAPGATASVVGKTREMILSASVEGIVGALEAMRDRVDSGPLLRNIAVPTMVLAGADDQLIPVAASRTIAAGIADSTLEVVAGAGHLVPIEAPDAFIAAFNRFLARLQ